MSEVYDVLGIGFGPSNIAFAIALEESNFNGSVLFLEKRESAQWHPNMLLPGTDIQNHPCRDLITPRNPRSRYTFLNFLHERGFLFEHLNLGIEFPLRREYAQYVSWVASFFERWVKYQQTVTSITACSDSEESTYQVNTDDGHSYFCQSLIVAPGRTPQIPPVFSPYLGPQIFHLTEYLAHLEALERTRPLQHICVVGGSQSAIEIVIHLSERHPDLRISNVMRGYGYRLKDTSEFSEQVFFPEFVDYYYRCDRDAKLRLDRHLNLTNYSAADHDVISHLYVKLYEDKLEGRSRIQLHTNQEIQHCEINESFISLRLREINTGEVTSLYDVDAVILATGFLNLGIDSNGERYPGILEGIVGCLRFDENDILCVSRDYRLLPKDPAQDLPPLYLNGLCESSHGFGDAGSFSLLSLRAFEICQSVIMVVGKKKFSEEEVTMKLVGG